VRYYFLLLFHCYSLLTHGQESSDKIQLLAKSKKQGIWLRWAPSNAAVWSLGNRYGYIVERFALKADGELENVSGEKLTATPLKPISEQEFERLSNQVEEASVVQELIYGEKANATFNANDPASILAHNRDNENQFGIALLMCDLSMRVAEATGLFFADTSAIKGKRYIYRISLAVQPKGITVEQGIAVIGATEEIPLSGINDLAAEFRDRSVMLQWNTLLHRGTYSAYYIEKSSDGTSFKKISDLPYIHMSESQNSETAYYVDSLEVNNKTFHYRIIGISPFAETGPSSNVVKGEGKNDLSGFLVLKEGKADNQKKVTLKWQFPLEAEKQIAGFKIAKSNFPGGPFTDTPGAIIPKNIRQFLDESSFYNTYYIVRAIDNTGKEVSRSFPFLVQIEDTTPPNVPTGLKGEVNEVGKVTLTWNKNVDPDLMGYRVFKANSDKEEFVEVTQSILNTPSFNDSVNTQVLDKRIFYKVIAVDNNFNTSDYSASINLKKPDIIAPVAPVFTVVEVKDGKLSLEWENSVSDDVAKLELTRIEKEDRTSRPIKSWNTPVIGNSYIEQTLTLGKTYRYKLVVYDSAGNSNEVLSQEIFFETGVRPAVSNIQSVVDRDIKKITLTWKNTAPAISCLIYRKKNDGSMILYKSLDGNVESFTDTSVGISNVYTYQVQLVFPKGVKSALSAEVKVNY
jgi:uncharacterized protein